VRAAAVPEAEVARGKAERGGLVKTTRSTSAAIPSGPDQWQVSNAGGESPLWSPDGKELYYASGDTISCFQCAAGRALRSCLARV